MYFSPTGAAKQKSLITVLKKMQDSRNSQPLFVEVQNSKTPWVVPREGDIDQYCKCTYSLSWQFHFQQFIPRLCFHLITLWLYKIIQHNTMKQKIEHSKMSANRVTNQFNKLRYSHIRILHRYNTKLQRWGRVRPQHQNLIIWHNRVQNFIS